MKILYLTLLFIICFTKSYSQKVDNGVEIEIRKEKNQKKIFAEVKINSTLFGGDSVWVKSIEKDIKQEIELSQLAKKGKYIVRVRFIQNNYGSLSDVICENDPGFSLCLNVTRALMKTNRWTKVKPIDIEQHKMKTN